MEKVIFSVETAVGEPMQSSETHLKPSWGSKFKQANSLGFHLGSDTLVYLFLHEGLFAGNPAEVNSLLQSDGVVAYIISCEGQEWTVKTEMTADNHFGLIVYTTSGKPYLAGELDVDLAGRWSAKFATLYPGIRNKKKCSLQGGVRGGTGQKTDAQIGGTCSVSF
jgi:hypothetical protein